jgi:hypothetical protein
VWAADDEDGNQIVHDARRMSRHGGLWWTWFAAPGYRTANDPEPAELHPSGTGEDTHRGSGQGVDDAAPSRAAGESQDDAPKLPVRVRA